MNELNVSTASIHRYSLQLFPYMHEKKKDTLELLVGGSTDWLRASEATASIDWSWYLQISSQFLLLLLHLFFVVEVLCGDFWLPDRLTIWPSE